MLSKHCLFFLIHAGILQQFGNAHDFHVENSGIFPVEEGDIGIRFYLTIANNINSDIRIVKAHKPECCWNVEPGDEDCDSMKLFGGFPTLIKRLETKNITYVFSNIYPHDRIGFCKFHLKQDVGLNAIVHKVHFNTSMYDQPGFYMAESTDSDVPPMLIKCSGIDENPRNSCNPFVCSKKYNGFRSFYRPEKGKCEPVHHCRTLLGDDNIPTSAFDFENNRCKNLIHDEVTETEKKVAKELLDSSPLAKAMHKYEDVDPNILLINCKNGVQEGRYCRCRKGWKTVSVLTAGGGVKMDWCSRKVKMKGKSKNKFLKTALITILSLISFGLLVLVLYLWWSLFIREIIGVSEHKSTPLEKGEQRADFPFKYNPVWEIGGEIFDSNTAAMPTSEEEINEHNLPNQVTKLPPRTRKSPAEKRRRPKLNEQTLHVTNSDRFVLVEHENAAAAHFDQH